MARKRLQRLGHLRKKGGSWILEWREYRRDENGNTVAVRRSAAIARYIGPGAITSERQVRREIVDPMLREIDQRAIRPETLMTLADFWRTKFAAYHIWKLKPAGQKHYSYVWRKLEPVIGQRRLADVTPEDIEEVLAQFHRNGFSSQTVRHFRNALSALFRCARRLGLYCRENPVSLTEAPPVEAARRPGYTVEQARRVLASLPSPVREMATLSLACSLNVSEMCGLRRKWVNVGEAAAVVDGEVLAPMSLAVREHYYNGRYGSLKTGRRRRIVPLTPELVEMLRGVMLRSRDQSPEAPVFQSRSGTPIDSHNVSNRIFKPLAERLGFPVTWHAFRRAHSTLAGQLEGIPVEDRVAMMGHSDASMTLYYSIPDTERRRELPRRILEELVGGAGNRTQ